jgi:predicted component of type VI protein secretion system
MEAKLVVTGGKVSKNVIPLTLPTTIGRGRDAKLTIAHPMVSRKHCQLFEKDGLLMIRDLGSLNGTMIAGQRIKEAPLPPDAEFTVGPLTFRAEYQYDGDLKALPDPVFEESTSPTGTLPDFQSLDALQVGSPAPSGLIDLTDEDLALIDAAARPTAPASKNERPAAETNAGEKNAAKGNPKKAPVPAKVDDDGLLLELEEGEGASGDPA